jgi:hypothetical protein
MFVVAALRALQVLAALRVLRVLAEQVVET